MLIDWFDMCHALAELLLCAADYAPLVPISIPLSCQLKGIQSEWRAEGWECRYKTR